MSSRSLRTEQMHPLPLQDGMEALSSIDDFDLDNFETAAVEDQRSLIGCHFYHDP